MANKSQEEGKLLDSLETEGDSRVNFLKEALHIAREAGSVIANVFQETKQNVQTKANCADLVTETDKAVEKLIFDYLRTKFPSHSFIGEESVSDGAMQCHLTENHTWVVDPIDGTMNFVHMNPNVAVSIGLAINKQTEVGVVYAPMLDQIYFGVRGHGSFLNGRRLSVSKSITDISQALIATEFGSRRDESVTTVCANIQNILMKHKVGGIRCTGSAALNMCSVASGAVDLYYEWGPQCWDVCASHVIVHEAGGVTTDALGQNFDMMSRSYICASNKHLIEQLVPSVTQISLAQ
ncbi:inositol monophosphatase 1-like [Clytia hemisphaerica]|uniref:Inositol-1-monophosphatase n=1 Tax=Clytia hemisphaerica TaxID=252671 RepID=A0A7M5WVK7_9CNID|eukprot:TCONS_00026435-protein